MRRFPFVLAAMLAGLASACGGASSPSALSPGVRTAPNLAAFLQLPLATPSSCPANVSGSSVGRASPWVGHVDVSVFLSPSATAREQRQVAVALRKAPIVDSVTFETKAQAYAEFQRLYTCWASVPRSQTPASYRVVLVASAPITQRNALVARLLHEPGVDTVSCDPSLPCTTIVQSASAAPTNG